MPANVAKDTLCPFCQKASRSDHIRRHLRTHAAAMLEAKEPNPAWTRLGQTKVFYTTNPCIMADGTKHQADKYKVGVCLECCCIINNTNTPSKLTAFEQHVCKEKQVRVRGEPKAPAAAPATAPAKPDYEGVWDDCRARVMNMRKPPTAAVEQWQAFKLKMSERFTASCKGAEDEDEGTDYAEALADMMATLAHDLWSAQRPAPAVTTHGTPLMTVGLSV
jgi:hypothetical protein